ncbi:MAG: hypothetical protein HC945_00765 [Nitrosarchaeum sp.]|nr:hypothetical protein [Nitrosarchaeum sp.]
MGKHYPTAKILPAGTLYTSGTRNARLQIETLRTRRPSYDLVLYRHTEAYAIERIPLFSHENSSAKPRYRAGISRRAAQAFFERINSEDAFFAVQPGLTPHLESLIREALRKGRAAGSLLTIDRARGNARKGLEDLTAHYFLAQT